MITLKTFSFVAIVLLAVLAGWILHDGIFVEEEQPMDNRFVLEIGKKGERMYEADVQINGLTERDITDVLCKIMTEKRDMHDIMFVTFGKYMRRTPRHLRELEKFIEMIKEDIKTRG